MSHTPLLFGERSLTLVGAAFDDYRAAVRARRVLRRDRRLRGQIALIAPDDPLVSMKCEPEQAGIWKTAKRSHAVLGAAGGALGLLAAGALAGSWDAAAASPGFAMLFLGVMGTFLGMLVGGLLTLRPDHGFVIDKLRSAIRSRHWALVVRPLSEPVAESAMARLRGLGAAPLRSI